MPNATVTKTISELRRHCQPALYSGSGQPWLFGQFRKVSIYLTWLLLHTPLMPNTITLIAIAGGILTAVLLALGYWITGLVMLFVVIALDFSDGEISRYHGTQSKEGSYLDKIYIFAFHPAPIAGMAIGTYNNDPTVWVLVAGFIDVISIFLFCMVAEYGLQIAVWKHCRRFLERLNRDPDFLKEQLLVKPSPSVEAGAASAPPLTETSFDTVRNSRFAAIVKGAASGWDFPYIFCFMAVAIVLQLIIGERTALGGLAPKLFLYFYAITYPPLICFLLLKNVAVKAVERNYQEVANEIIQVLQKARI